MTTNFNNGPTANIRSFFDKFFLDNGINAYYFSTRGDAATPYIVWLLRELTSYGMLPDNNIKAKRYIMEINGFNKSGLIVLENMFDFLEEILHTNLELNDDFFITANVAFSRFTINAGDEMQHLRTTFEIKYFS